MINKLLVVGTMAYDAIETPFGKVEHILGGAATYIAFAATNFKSKIGIISVIGEDFKSEDLKLLTNRGVDISGVEIIKGGKTFFWSGKYHSNINFRDTIETQLNVLENFEPKVPKVWTNPKILLLGNLHPAVQLSALNQMVNKPELIILDSMNFWMDNFRSILDKVISKIDVLCINDEEALQLSNENSIYNASQSIQKMGPKYVIIKRGENGAMIFYKDKMFLAPAYPLKDVKDPTGAGDSFVGGFSGYLSQQSNISFESMKVALVYASAMASFTVQEFGTHNLQKVDKFVLQNRIDGIQNLTKLKSELINTSEL
jgi:sugar/nucleoside kinase (ribokinase family)